MNSMVWGWSLDEFHVWGWSLDEFHVWGWSLDEFHVWGWSLDEFHVWGWSLDEFHIWGWSLKFHVWGWSLKWIPCVRMIFKWILSLGIIFRLITYLRMIFRWIPCLGKIFRWIPFLEIMFRGMELDRCPCPNITVVLLFWDQHERDIPSHKIVCRQIHSNLNIMNQTLVKWTVDSYFIRIDLLYTKYEFNITRYCLIHIFSSIIGDGALCLFHNQPDPSTNGHANLFLSANHPILVAQVTSSMTAPETIGDPSMVIIPPITLHQVDYTFTTPDYWNTTVSGYTHYLVIVITEEYQNDMVLDDVPLGVLNWIPVEGSEPAYVTASFEVSAGTHRVYHMSSIAKFSAILYGAADEESYAFPLGMNMAPINEVGICILIDYIIQSIKILIFMIYQIKSHYWKWC